MKYSSGFSISSSEWLEDVNELAVIFGGTNAIPAKVQIESMVLRTKNNEITNKIYGKAEDFS